MMVQNQVLRAEGEEAIHSRADMQRRGMQEVGQEVEVK